MRKLIFLLFIVNGCLLAWFIFQQDRKMQQQPEQVEFDFSQVPTVTLLSELSDSELAARDKVRIAEQQRRKEAASKQICYLIGAFDSAQLADRMRIRLDYFEAANIVEQTVQMPSTYWAYIEPQATRQAALALAKRLKSDGFDSYAVPSGSDINAVALGTFSKLASAEGVAEKAKAAGYEVAVAEREQTAIAYYIALNQEATEQFEMASLEQIRVDVAEVKIEEKACKTLALLPAIQ
ncbi:MAG: SPOR domain-containing protein [Pseudomonadales bacterium]|nr:SPOR domain-containing protein [Pseudomonadales bacterium]